MTTTTLPASSDGAGGDVVTVGHEIGHIAADGTIVGRAEPYAKVFASSRQVKRAVGVMAWAILEDIALDARIDHTGRLVAATNVRRIAANLGVSKNTVARHLTRLRDAGFVLHEEGDHDHDGRYTVSRYVLDPSACVERFTHTPSRHELADTHDASDEARVDVDQPRDRDESAQDDADADAQALGDTVDPPGGAVHVRVDHTEPVESLNRGSPARATSGPTSTPTGRSRPP